MALADFFKRKPTDDAGGSARTVSAADAVEKVRTRTRQRLIGAVLLLTLGVIGFPLLFESQPRPIPVDIPIEIPKPDGTPALTAPARLPVTAPEAAVASGVVTRDAPAEPAPAPASEPAEPVVASAPSTASAAAPTATAKAVAPAATTSTAKTVAAAAKPAAAAEPVASSAPSPKSATTAEGSARYVVQVGAFAESAAAREVRLKMEKLGLKTYTQVAETSAGKRIRVRLGPFVTRAEADKAQARAKEAGVAAVVLTL